MLKTHGYQVIEASDGAEAYVLAREHAGPIHLLLTDVVMPGMNGKELSDRIRGIRPGIKVLFSSGYTADVIAHHGVLDPELEYIAKPFSAKALMTKVREVISK
jgi:YesN/AraC family two-component response regulator